MAVVVALGCLAEVGAAVAYALLGALLVQRSDASFASLPAMLLTLPLSALRVPGRRQGPGWLIESVAGCATGSGVAAAEAVGFRHTGHRSREVSMPGTVARVTEISAKSDVSFEDAVKVAVERARQSLRGVTSAWVKEQEVEVGDSGIVAYKVNLLVTFILE